MERSDREAIVALTVDYGWAIDSGDWDALRRIFTADAVTDLGGGGQRGIEQIIERVSSALAPLDDSQHLIASHQVELDGDRARCRCYLQAQHIRRGVEGGSIFTVGGRYEDDLVRTPDGWRIARRRLVVMWRDGNPAVFAP